MLRDEAKRHTREVREREAEEATLQALYEVGGGDTRLCAWGIV